MKSKNKMSHPRLWISVSTALFGTVLVLSACSATSLDILARNFGFYEPRQAEQTRDLAHQIIVPGYQYFANASTVLEQSIAELNSQPTAAKLQKAQEAWKQAASAWDQTESYRFGPVNDLRLAAQIHYWPKRVADIESVLKSESDINVQQLGASKRGLPVLEYLLFGPGSESLTQSGAATSRRLDYAKALSMALRSDAEKILTAWKGPQNSYLQTYLQDPAARNLLLNQWVMLLEDSKNKRLGIPSGQIENTQIDGSLLEASYCQCSKELLLASLQSFIDSFEGPTGSVGLDDSLIAMGYRPLQEKIQKQTRTVIAQIHASPDSLEVQLKTHPATFNSQYQQMIELLRLVKVDLANALNETVHFTDNDGD